MPMGGKGSRFKERGFDVPKPLIELAGKPFFFWATQSVSRFIPLNKLVFVVLREHVRDYDIDKSISHFYREAQIKVIEDMHKEGPLFTVMDGLELIDDDVPFLVNDCDHLFRSRGFEEFLDSKETSECDGALLTFPSHSPNYSYIEYDREGSVTGTAEKKVVSDMAICGAYYFKNKKVFDEAAAEYIHNCSYNEFFMSGLYNVMISEKMKVSFFKTDFHIPFGTPEEYDLAKDTAHFEELL